MVFSSLKTTYTRPLRKSNILKSGRHIYLTINKHVIFKSIINYSGKRLISLDTKIYFYVAPLNILPASLLMDLLSLVFFYYYSCIFFNYLFKKYRLSLVFRKFICLELLYIFQYICIFECDKLKCLEKTDIWIDYKVNNFM